LPNVEVLEGDGGHIDPGASDAIFVNAGVTHPRSAWLDPLRLGGRLLLLLTDYDEESGHGGGAVLEVKRQSGGFPAHFISRVGVFPCLGSRDPGVERALERSL
jgi:protein-L-isoaspartate(D-aspartate) O-methyltransferase